MGADDVVYCDNVDFSGNHPVTKTITTNGQILIGSTVAPNIRVGALGSSDGSITWTSGSGTITGQVSGGTTVGKTITGNTGGALSPTAGNWNIVTSNSTTLFAGAGSTLTVNYNLSNLAFGTSMPVLTSGILNVILGGGSSGAAITSGGGNTLIGSSAGTLLSTGNNNVFVGIGAGFATTNASDCVAIGNGSLTGMTSPGPSTNNTAVGKSTLGSLTTGTNNLALGIGGGSLYTSTESSNILLMNNGTAAESNTIRIGTQGSSTAQQDRCFIAGISGVTTAQPSVVSLNTSTGQLAQVLAGTSGNILTSNGTNWVSAAPATSGTVTSVSGTTNQVAVANGTTTPVISLVGPYTPATYTAHGVLIGEGTSSIVALAAGSVGQVLQSGGASADPAYSTATYPSTASGTGTLLRANGTNWVATTSTYPTTNAVSTLLYASATNVMSALATANNGVLITSATGVPSLLAAGTTGQVLTATTGSPAAWTALPTNQSNVLASLATTIPNVTGDNTFYGPILFDTEAFDLGSNYNPATGLFTVPTTGRYLCCCSVSLESLGAAHLTGEFRLLLNGSTYTRSSFNPYVMSAGGIFTYTFSLEIPATATNTLSFGCVVAGSTKTVGIQGNNFGNYSFANFIFMG